MYFLVEVEHAKSNGSHSSAAISSKISSRWHGFIKSITVVDLRLND